MCDLITVVCWSVGVWLHLKSVHTGVGSLIHIHGRLHVHSCVSVIIIQLAKLLYMPVCMCLILLQVLRL